MYTRIVVPLDGSELAELGLPHGEELARLAGSPLHLVRIVVPVPTAGFAMAEHGYSDTLFAATSREEAAADDYLVKLRDRYATRNIQVTIERRTGKVIHELLAVARDGDLYVIASHGRGGVSRWFLGSVAEEITRHSRVPVMIVRADTADHERSAATRRVPVLTGERQRN
jgi:nucleotide-binding universal stress UspA family protein